MHACTYIYSYKQIVNQSSNGGNVGLWHYKITLKRGQECIMDILDPRLSYALLCKVMIKVSHIAKVSIIYSITEVIFKSSCADTESVSLSEPPVNQQFKILSSSQPG